MRLCKQVFVIVLFVSGVCLSGCTLEEGFRDGISDGVSGALSAMIEAPVNFALEQTFQEP